MSAKPLTIVGLGGSLASNSRSRAALQTALAGAAKDGAETQLLDIRRLDLPYVVPVAAAARVFDREGRIQDEAVELQLNTLGGEVVRVARRFAADDALHRQHECDLAAERVAIVA